MALPRRSMPATRQGAQVPAVHGRRANEKHGFRAQFAGELRGRCGQGQGAVGDHEAVLLPCGPTRSSHGLASGQALGAQFDSGLGGQILDRGVKGDRIESRDAGRDLFGAGDEGG